MKTKSHHQPSSSAYTLIEILVVIAIIGILSSMVFVGARRVMGTAKKGQAQNAAMQVIGSISAYQSEYRRMPIDNASGQMFVDVATDRSLMDVLLAADSDIGKRLNSKRISYFSGRSAKKIANDRYVSGIQSSGRDGGGSLWDPFGQLYGVRIGTQSRNLVDNPAITPPNLDNPKWGSGGSLANEPEVINEDVIIWSGGKNFESDSDNIRTWR